MSCTPRHSPAFPAASLRIPAASLRRLAHAAPLELASGCSLAGLLLGLEAWLAAALAAELVSRCSLAELMQEWRCEGERRGGVMGERRRGARRGGGAAQGGVGRRAATRALGTARRARGWLVWCCCCACPLQVFLRWVHPSSVRVRSMSARRTGDPNGQNESKIHVRLGGCIGVAARGSPLLR